MASATPCTGCYPGWPHSYPETQRDWILRFWTRGHRPDSQLLYENFEQVTHAEALKRKAVLEAKWRTMRTHAGRVLVEMILRCHLKPFFGEMKVEDMRALDVDSYRTPGTRRRPSKRSPRPRRSRENETGTRAR